MYTEKDLILHAKKYIDKLSDGINPLNDLQVNMTDIVTEDKIRTCLKYVSKWLYQYHQLLSEPKEQETNIKTKTKTETKIFSETKSCENCKHYRNSDCGGLKLCQDYDYAPTFTTEVTSLWPKEGDATYFKRTGKSRN